MLKVVNFGELKIISGGADVLPLSYSRNKFANSNSHLTQELAKNIKRPH